MSPASTEAWQVFPWDRDAGAGAPYSPGWVPRSQGQGRFDRPNAPGGVIYLAETPVHAVAETIQHFRGQRLDARDLRLGGHPLALVRVSIEESIGQRLVDLCDPAVLLELGIRADETASSSRRTTQRIAERVYGPGQPGLRWWSALRGEWHTLVLFRDRIGRGLQFDVPETLTLGHEAVLSAMQALGMAVMRV